MEYVTQRIHKVHKQTQRVRRASELERQRQMHTVAVDEVGFGEDEREAARTLEALQTRSAASPQDPPTFASLFSAMPQISPEKARERVVLPTASIAPGEREGEMHALGQRLMAIADASTEDMSLVSLVTAASEGEGEGEDSGSEF
ncbi:hypothetical protein KIPB_009583 [Kipferlia bialata]|uniref:Uncharacterized protein n=1 Tax=Kipferlia bialata TaxID=797122 RepID=A0A391NNY4_9EUKA|nr:hypothetical protein KIPB_009583 [Kipferlia bialata]|eukprot:g9583.t1